MITQNLLDLASQLIAEHEGLSLTPYLCPAGKLTIGYGRNIEENGISEEEAAFLLKTDINNTLKQLHTLPFFADLDPVRQVVLIDMCFNLGYPRFSGFKKMIQAVADQDYELAALEMMDSRWAHQVGQRAKRLSNMMKRGNFD